MVETGIASLKDRVIKSIEGLAKYSGYVVIRFDDGNEALFQHEQECCEYVTLEDFGDAEADDFTGAVIHEAYESQRRETDSDEYESATWTFYRILTSNGPLVLRWIGRSNGYYSESVDVTVFPSSTRNQ